MKLSVILMFHLSYPNLMFRDSTPEDSKKIREWKQTERKKEEVTDMMLELERVKKPTVIQPKPQPEPKSEPVKYMSNKENKVVQQKAILPVVKPHNAFYAQLDSLLENNKNDAAIENSITNFIAKGDKSAQERLFDILQNNENTKQYFEKYKIADRVVPEPSTHWLTLITGCLIGIVGTVILTKPILNEISKYRRDRS